MNAATDEFKSNLRDVPVRSPRTSIVLAEAVRRRAEAQNRASRPRAFLQWVSQLFDFGSFGAIAERRG
jgi:hypothetical protein